MGEVKKDIELLLADSLEKVFPDETPSGRALEMTALRGETVSFQAAYRYNGTAYIRAKAVVETELPYRVRRVGLVPSGFPCYAESDAHYLRREPGMYPDLLEDIEGGDFVLPRNQWHSLWIDLKIPESSAPGSYEVRVSLAGDEDGLSCGMSCSVCVIAAELPVLPIRHTEWFYADCLADYYHVEAYGEEHWSIIENFMRIYAKRRCNMILTPVFTPPLDTFVGGERTCVQLADITLSDGRYSFDFTKLGRWVRLAQDCGIKYFEISHLFTQWGVKAAPNIYAAVDGTYRRIFGWDTPATGGAYEKFLRVFLPQLTAELRRLGIAERCYFHVSDEPQKETLEDYKKAKDIVSPYLEGFHMMDALSEYAYYADGLVEIPVCASNHMEDFLEHNVDNLWSYYCCAQYKDVANRFIAMPSYRSRIFGIQLYLYNIKGMLHWGFNFYNSVTSKSRINPYRVTDCDYGMPSGDSFLVYPGEGGLPEESLRLMVIDEAMADYCALCLLESLAGRENVIKLIDSEAGMKITFKEYPHDAGFILRLRNKVNLAIREAIDANN